MEEENAGHVRLPEPVGRGLLLPDMQVSRLQEKGRMQLPVATEKKPVLVKSLGDPPTKVHHQLFGADKGNGSGLSFLST